MCEMHGRAQNCQPGMPSRSSISAHADGVMYSGFDAWRALRSIVFASSSFGRAVNHGTTSWRSALEGGAPLGGGNPARSGAAVSRSVPPPKHGLRKPQVIPFGVIDQLG